MQSLLRHLMVRGISGTASAAEERVLEFLANPKVNRRVFGQPLAGTVGYYFTDYLCLLMNSEEMAGKPRSSTEPTAGTTRGR